MNKYKHSVFIAYWGTEDIHGSYARARSIYRDVEESLALPLPYINSNKNDVLFTEHKDSTIQDSKLFLLVLNSDCPTNASGHIDENRCSALCEEILTFISLIKEKKRLAKDFAIYFESNAIDLTAQFAYLKRLLQKIDPEGVLVNGNSNFHLKSTMQILNWINDRWANENNDQPSTTCSNQPTSTPMVALGNMFSMAYTLSKSLFSFPLPQQNNLMAEQDFLSVLKTAEDMLNFYQSKIPPHQKTSFNQASLALHKLMEYSQRLTEALPTTYIKEVATLYTNFFDIVITPILSLLSRSDLLHIKTGGYLGLLFKLKALTLVEGIDQSSDMENYIQMIFSNLPYLKIQPQTADKVRESLIELPYSQNEDDISLLDMLCDFIVDDLNCA